MTTKILPPVEYLRECFDCCPDSGTISWRVRPLAHFKCPGDHAKHLKMFAGRPLTAKRGRGYLSVTINGRSWFAHRIIYKMATGDEPASTLDHINGDITDNRISNLRAADRSQNSANSSGRKNATGFRGIYRWEQRGIVYYSGSVSFRKKRHRIGYHKTPEAAHAAYIAKAREVHGEFFREP